MEVKISYCLVSEKTFENAVVVLDNSHFHKCSFLNCTLLYAGAPFLFDDCVIGNETRWEIQGPLSLALGALAKAGWSIRQPEGRSYSTGRIQ